MNSKNLIRNLTSVLIILQAEFIFINLNPEISVELWKWPYTNNKFSSLTYHNPERIEWQTERDSPEKVESFSFS